METVALSSGVWPVIRELVSLTKPRVSSLVLLTSAAGLVLAKGHLPLPRLLAMQIGMVLIVGCANALNCWMERESDALMRRTSGRSLPAGRLSPQAALAFALLLLLISVPVLSLLVNPLTGFLGALSVALYVGVYTPLKTRTPSALVVGAIPGALPPLMGVTAVTGELSALGFVLFGILFLWQMPHVIGLSCYCKADYERAGIRVLPAVRGDQVAKWHALLWSLPLIPCSLLLVPLGVGGAFYGGSALLLGCLYSATALYGLRQDHGARWGRRLFLVSLSYLPLLFTALSLDAGL